MVVGGLTLEEETESYRILRRKVTMLGLDTELLAVTGMNTVGEGAEVGEDKRLGNVGSEEGSDMRLVGEGDMDGEEHDGMV